MGEQGDDRAAGADPIESLSLKRTVESMQDWRESRPLAEREDYSSLTFSEV